ncbi:MAG: SIMPL domain-containing protein [Gemmatimonadaceae bacterium]|nr:SIMPL domain-containing protein [Gemmatimonadaceae bacterium]
MKLGRSLFACVLSLAAPPLTLSAQTQPRDTTIVVNVTRVGRVAADRASLYFGIEAIAETAPLAVARLQSKIAAVMDSVKRASSASRAEAPFVLGVSPNVPNGYPQSGAPLQLARAAVRVVVNKLSDLPMLQLAVSGAGALVSSPPTYESTSTDSIWRAKVAEALTAARASAEVSAESQGYKLGRLLTMNVSGGPAANPFAQQTQLMFDGRSGYSSVFPQETSVNATVSVTYLLVKK